MHPSLSKRIARVATALEGLDKPKMPKRALVEVNKSANTPLDYEDLQSGKGKSFKLVLMDSQSLSICSFALKIFSL